jgi:gluconate 2-dehydrogenase gamma chain
MRRRDVLRSLSALALGPLLSPLSAGQRMRLGAALHAGPTVAAGARLEVLDARQAALVLAVADTVLPRTDTPGALDAGVVEFLDRLLSAWHTELERTQFLAGLESFDAQCRDATGLAFDALDGAGRSGFLSGVDGAPRGAPGTSPAFYARLKEVTVFAFLTSKPVQEAVFKTPIIPGRFEGCVPVSR